MSDNEATIDFTELNRQNADKRKGNAKNSPNKYRKVAPDMNAIQERIRKQSRNRSVRLYYENNKELLLQKNRDRYGFNPREELTDEERQRRIRASKAAYLKKLAQRNKERNKERDKELAKKPICQLTQKEFKRLKYLHKHKNYNYDINEE